MGKRKHKRGNWNVGGKALRTGPWGEAQDEDRFENPEGLRFG